MSLFLIFFVFQQLHSEYRSTYTWHEYTGPHQEHTVVRRAPQAPPTSILICLNKSQSKEYICPENRRSLCAHERRHRVFWGFPKEQMKERERVRCSEKGCKKILSKKLKICQNRNRCQLRILIAAKQVTAKLQSAKSTEDENNTEGPTLEPPLPRRKKCPELAYRHHEFITAADAGGIDAVDTNVVADKVREVTGNTALPASQLSKAISRISTEYRLQFAWPRRAQLTNGDVVSQLPAAGGAGGNAGGPPRKSLSMGALKQGIPSSGPAPVHMKKRPGDVDHKRDDDLPMSTRSVTKEEKEKENTRKVAPNMPPAGRPSSVQARPIYEILQDDLKAVDTEKAIARARKEFLIRHHLDRTTGICDGALLPSPTREKLEPVVPRRRDDSKESTHREEIQPRTKSSPKNSPRTGRSQSMGPLSRSPKRQTPRTPSVSKDIKEKEKEHKDKEARDRSGDPERHPRPSNAVAGVSAVGRVRWSIRESPKSSSSSSKPPVVVSSVKSSTLNEQPIPPLPPPPGPGPTPLQRRPSPRVQRKPFLATTASPRPLHLAAKTNLPPTTTTTTTTTTTNTKVTPNKLHQSAYERSNGRSGIRSASAAATSSGSRSLDRVTSNNRKNLSLSHSPASRARGSAKAKATTAPTADHPSKSSFTTTDNRIQSYRANAALQASK
ncbi:hypothetical protein G9C98_003143 [Cotesia typhae]|uniref:Uncharacterized protein n=1 Tax=Cotesia typhae TaxID=2053667 RepID=A0A8J5UZC7_9HYME|nr:hypothetical protein G9C98_003143 [Cotesia typhae]